MRKLFKGLITFVAIAGLTGCVSDEKIAEAMKKNPQILVDAMKANPVEFMSALQEVARDAKEGMKKKQEEEEAKKMEEVFKNPLKPMIRPDETVRGTKGGPIVLVEYSDFQCPFCTRGYGTVVELMKKYPGKVQFIYKHLPLSFHKEAMPAAQYYEALRLQSEEAAFKFHDELFANQQKIKNGEPYLKAVASKIAGVDMKKLLADVNSDAVKNRINEDMQEAAKFGIQGTPGFIINGIPVKGAYPASYFDEIIGKLKAKGMLTL